MYFPLGHATFNFSRQPHDLSRKARYLLPGKSSFREQGARFTNARLPRWLASRFSLYGLIELHDSLLNIPYLTVAHPVG